MPVWMWWISIIGIIWTTFPFWGYLLMGPVSKDWDPYDEPDMR